MQPLTGKELEYLADCMSNEDLLAKQSMVALTHVQNQAVQAHFKQVVKQHQQHYQELLTILKNHVNIAPKMQ